MVGTLRVVWDLAFAHYFALRTCLLPRCSQVLNAVKLRLHFLKPH